MTDCMGQYWEYHTPFSDIAAHSDIAVCSGSSSMAQWPITFWPRLLPLARLTHPQTQGCEGFLSMPSPLFSIIQVSLASLLCCNIVTAK